MGRKKKGEVRLATDKDGIPQVDGSLFWKIMAAVFFGNFMCTLSTTSVNVALPVFVDEFAAPMSTVQWMMSGYMLATGVIAPIIGFLGDKIGYKQLYGFSLLGFTISSALCIIAWNMESLIVFRILQGAFSGMVMPSTMTILYQLIPRRRQALAIGLWSMSSMLAPAFGPTLGGFLTEYFGWQAIFSMNIPIGLIGVFLIFRYIPSYRMSSGVKLDVLGFVFVVIGTTALLYGFSKANSWGWLSVPTLVTFLIAVLALVYFFIHTFRSEKPLLNLKVLKVGRFANSLLINCVITISLYAGTFIVPVYMQQVKLSTAFDTGLVLLPGSLILAILSFFVGRHYDFFGPFKLIMTGTIIMAFTTWMMTDMDITTGVWFVTLWLAVRYVGVAMCNMPVVNAAMQVIPKELSGHASAVTNWIRQASAALAISFFGGVLSSQTENHLADITADSESVLSGDALQSATHEATTLAVQDVFFLAVVLILIAVPFIFTLLKKAHPVSVEFLEMPGMKKARLREQQKAKVLDL